MMFSRILAFLLVVAAVLWIGSGVLGREEPHSDPAAETEAPAAAPFRVAVLTGRLENHARSLTLSGRTEADDRARAVARTTGSIVELKVRRGAVVKEGDVLAILSDEAREARVTEAKAMLDMRRNDLDVKLPLIERGIVAANERRQLEADLRAAEAAVAVAEAELERGQVRAPISGMVSDVPATTGQSLELNAVVAEIVALEPMLAVVEIAERQLAGIDVGDRANARLVTGAAAEGVVRFVSPTASEGTRTYRVDVELDRGGEPIPDGVTAEVEFRLAAVPAMRVPRSALTFWSEGLLSVRTVDSAGMVASVAVEVVEDARQDMWVAGLEDGTRVIVQGQDFVKDGQRVEAVPADDAGAPALVSR